MGCYCGARLHKTGQYDIRFHMRGEHLAVSQSRGLNVTSPYGDIFIPPAKVRAYSDPADMGVADWVIVALKSTSLAAAPGLVRPLLGNQTRVLAIMNGMVDEDLIDLLEGTGREGDGAACAGPGRRGLTRCAAVYGGMALVCSNRVGPGEVHHSYAGKLTGALAASASAAWRLEGDQEAERAAFLALWEPTKIEHVYDSDLVRGRWAKMCWNLPYNGISVAMGGITVDKIVSDPGLRRLAERVMDETITAGNAELAARGANPATYLGRAEKEAMVLLSDGMGPYKPSTMLDMHHRRPMEVKYLFRRAVERAQALHVPVPHLETLVAQIEAFQRMYNL